MHINILFSLNPTNPSLGSCSLDVILLHQPRYTLPQSNAIFDIRDNSNNWMIT